MVAATALVKPRGQVAVREAFGEANGFKLKRGGESVAVMLLPDAAILERARDTTQPRNPADPLREDKERRFRILIERGER